MFTAVGLDVLQLEASSWSHALKLACMMDRTANVSLADVLRYPSEGDAISGAELRAAVVQVRGDWSFHKSTFQLNGWKPEGRDGRMCFRCLAGTKRYPFTDVSITADWRATLLTNDLYVQLLMQHNLSGSEICGFPRMKYEYFVMT